MPKPYTNTLKSHASAVTDLAKVLLDIAQEHRVEASKRERNADAPSNQFPDWIASLAEVSAAVERLLELEIELARKHGMTWDAVAEVLGVRRQSAWERYGTHQRWDRTHRTSRHRRVQQERMFRRLSAGRGEEEIGRLRLWLGLPPRGRATSVEARDRSYQARKD